MISRNGIAVVYEMVAPHWIFLRADLKSLNNGLGTLKKKKIKKLVYVVATYVVVPYKAASQKIMPFFLES